MIRVEGKTGSGGGLPSVFLKKVTEEVNDDGKVVIEAKTIESGSVGEIFIHAKDIQLDTRVENIRALNPAKFE